MSDDIRMYRETIDFIEGCMTRCWPEYTAHWEKQRKRYFKLLIDRQLKDFDRC